MSEHADEHPRRAADVETVAAPTQDAPAQDDALVTGGPVTDIPATGNPQVDAAVRSVQDLGERPVAEHVEVFEAAHQALRGALSAGAPGPQQVAQAGRPAPAPGARPGDR